MLEFIIGVAVIVTLSLVLGHGKDDLYDTTKVAACTEEDYELAANL